MSRRLAREIAFKAIFQQDVGKNELEPTLSGMLEEVSLNEEDTRFVRELVEGTLANQDAIDDVLEKYLVNWQFDRLAAVDRSVLRMAAYEILYRPDIPVTVSINEALEIIKMFNEEHSVKFLNGVLDKLARDREAGSEVE
jgi:N utilization substance protein B